MINAVIQNGDQTAVLKLPDDPFTLQYDLSQIGVRIRLRDIPIKDDEDSATNASGGQSITEPAEATTAQEINHAAQQVKAPKPVRTG